MPSCRTSEHPTLPSDTPLTMPSHRTTAGIPITVGAGSPATATLGQAARSPPWHQQCGRQWRHRGPQTSWSQGQISGAKERKEGPGGSQRRAPEDVSHPSVSQPGARQSLWERTQSHLLSGVLDSQRDKGRRHFTLELAPGGSRKGSDRPKLTYQVESQDLSHAPLGLFTSTLSSRPGSSSS